MFKQTNKFERFENKVRLASLTMHGDELKYVQDAFDKNWRAKDNRDNR